MTMTYDIGKIKVKLEHQGSIGRRHREVELDVIWVSCGVYEVRYTRPFDAKDPRVLGVEDWYPPDSYVSFTPEEFEKIVELYPAAPKHKRDECYKPFYENYDLDRCMFDMECDKLLQAFKHPLEDVDKIFLVCRHFVHGTPTTESGMLTLFMEDFQKLKDLIESKKDQIFYSGCKISLK